MDDGAGGFRVSSQALRPRPIDAGGLSVYVEELLIVLGLSMFSALEGHSEFGLVALSAEVVRDEGLKIELRPDPHDGPRGNAHAVIYGDLSHGVRKRLADLAEIRVLPADPM
ncbi:MAG: hypothetical protein ACLQHS_10900 [Candidatus Limnocylindrales bacterium]